MRHIGILLTLLTLFGGSLAAQYHNSGYFAVTWRAKTVAFGLHIDPTGTVRTMQLGTAHQNACQVASDNRLILVCDGDKREIWQIDPLARAITGTLFADPALGPRIYGLEYDHNGDLYVITGSSIVRLDPAGALTTVTTGPMTLSNATIDIDTGDLLVATGLSTGTLRRIDRLNGTETTLATGFSPRFGDAAQDPITGDIYVPTCCGVNMTPPRSLDVLRAGQTVSTIYLASSSLAGAYGVQMDRASAANRRLVTGCIRNALAPASGGVWTIDLASATTRKLASFTTSTVTDVAFIGGRNLHARRTAPGRYRIDISVPNDAGRGYVLGLSVSGVRPGVTLADGRRIPLRPDGLTLLGLQDRLAPLATGLVGNLDALGRSTARIDVGGLYASIRGIVLWAAVVTLDPQSPTGFATVCDPLVLKID